MIEARLLAATQDFRALKMSSLREKEGAENGAGFFLAQAGGAGQNLVEHRLVRIQCGRTMLAEITDFGIVPEIAFSLLERHHPGENFQ